VEVQSRPRVVVTRAADQAGGLSERLRAAGCDVVEVPVVEIVGAPDGGAALRDALSRLGEYDWLVVTSPNGAALVREAVEGMSAARPKLAAVGPATADALGAPAHLVAGEAIGEGLVSDFPTGSGRVLLVQAEGARPVVAEGLRAKGWAVDAVVGYRTVAVRPPSAALAAADGADAIAFTSGSTVRAYVAAAGLHAVPRVVVTIGPATTEVAVALGLHVTATAVDHSLDGLVRALVGVLEAPDRP
jgi:uroporphyrinogen-III synthase